MRSLTPRLIMIALGLLVFVAGFEYFFGKGVFRGASVQGRVINAESNQPIAGALVIVKWYGNLSSFADSSTECYHVLTTISDKNGYYQTPAWVKSVSGWKRRVQERDVFNYAHVKNYKFVKTTKDDVIYLKPLKGSRKEKFKYVWDELTGHKCLTDDKYQNNVLVLREMLLKELEELAETEEEKGKVIRRRNFYQKINEMKNNAVTNKDSVEERKFKIKKNDTQYLNLPMQ